MFGRFHDFVILICLVIAQIKEHLSFDNSPNLPKCCASDFIMETTNLGYNCEPNIDRRIYLLNKQSSYLNMNKSSSNSKEESCIDINNNTSQNKYIISEYFLKNGSISKGRVLDLPYFYKCCPLGYIYNPQTHSCRIDKDKATLVQLIENYSPFIRIGLPHCKIIVDKYFNSISDFVVNNKDFSLFLKSSKEKLEDGSYCIDSTTQENFVVRKCETDFSVCEKVSCLKKCCPDGKSFINSIKYCRDTHEKGINISGFANISVDHQGNFAIVIYGSRCNKMYGLKNNYSINENGIFNVREKLEHTNKSIFKSYPIEEDSYCIDYMQKIKRFVVFRCPPQNPDQITQKFLLSRYSMMVSCVFIILTIVCYFISLEIRSLFGKILVTYCICLFVLYALLVNSTYYLSVNLLTCKLLGFFTTYAHFSVFTWLNIMSFDIFDTFGSGIVINVSRKNRDLRRYLLYSSYGWGLPLALTLIVIIFHYADIFPDVMKIAIGVKQCSIRAVAGQGNYAAVIFIFIPMSIMVLANVVMFVRTILYCLAVKKEISEMDDAKIFRQKKTRFKARKDQLFLIIKLCCIMGVALLFEVLSSFVNFKENSITEKIEIVFDLFNTLQGLFIFIIFICKRRILNMMLQRMHRVELRRKSAISDFTLYSSDPNTSIFISLKSMENINQQAKPADDKT